MRPWLSAAKGLSHTLLMFDSFHDVEEAKAGNAHAKQVLQSWADAEWFLNRPALAEKITITVFKVTSETNTDDLSPAPDAWSRPDIPLHALAMLKNRPGITPDKDGVIGPITSRPMPLIQGCWLYGVTWSVPALPVNPPPTPCSGFMGDDICVRAEQACRAGVCLGGRLPHLFNTMEDAGALPIEVDVPKLGDGRCHRHLPL